MLIEQASSQLGEFDNIGFAFELETIGPFLPGKKLQEYRIYEREYRNI
jgi:hypothetical protein